MKRPFFISPLAEQDVEDIASYIDLDNPDAGHRFLASVYETATLVALFPRIYPVLRDPVIPRSRGILRRCPLSGFTNILLYYSIRKDDRIVIRRVIHSAQDLGRAVKDAGL